MTFYRIVKTDNFAGDYPDEKFVNLPLMNEDKAKKVCSAINLACSGLYAPRIWMVKPSDYKLQPGFEP